jgi:hypothetical protein
MARNSGTAAKTRGVTVQLEVLSSLAALLAQHKSTNSDR